MNQGIETLTKASHQVAELIYRQAAASQQGGGGQGGPGGATGGPAEDSSKEGEVIDAEYVDAEEKK
jgi:molecular chaperone DnaK